MPAGGTEISIYTCCALWTIVVTAEGIEIYTGVTAWYISHHLVIAVSHRGVPSSLISPATAVS